MQFLPEKAARNYNLTFKLLIFLIISAFVVISPLKAQKTGLNKYGVYTIKNLEAYRESVRKDSVKELIELKSIIPGLVYDLKYASRKNFMGKKMYPGNGFSTFLRREPAYSLLKVQKEAGKIGLGLKIFDAYRPFSVTEKFWELVKDERYVANPSKGSGHNRGLAVDLTLIDLHSGKEIEMGTGFDNFTDTAHHSFQQLHPSILNNRDRLKRLMEKFGFHSVESEWWHYYWPDDQSFELLDLPFKDLRRSARKKN